MKLRKNIIISIVIFACIIMGYVDAILHPGYFVKSVIKVILFLLLPSLYKIFDKKCNFTTLFKPDKSGILKAFGFGFCIFAIIISAFLIFRNIFDFSGLTSSLTASTGVNKNNFVFVAIYISFANSLLEEFFFRGFAFLKLKEVSNRKTAYIISSIMFSFYHIAMMIGWFAFPVLLLSLIGLFSGGVIFNYFNEKYNNIYLSWLIHMFANFAINTIGFILFSN